MEPFQLLRNCLAFARAAPHPATPQGFRLSADQEPITKVCTCVVRLSSDLDDFRVFLGLHDMHVNTQATLPEHTAALCQNGYAHACMTAVAVPCAAFGW